MQNKLIPIKRSKQLAPLSREHHDGLLFAWKLRQGLDNNVSLETLRNYCQWYWKHHIKQHFHQEEDILLKFVPADNKMARQLKVEHNEIRDLVISIGHKPDTIIINMLADFVCRHIRFEERMFFPYLEQTLSAEQLDTICKQLEVEPVCSSEWKEEFWRKNTNKQ